jgi:hypothetical protein
MNHARLLVDYFDVQAIAQASGLDVGMRQDESGKSEAISVELVQGKKEEVYWEKVPEKVRKQAVLKALAFAAPAIGRDEPEVTETESRKRKRRRRQ